METFLIFMAIGFCAQMVDGALGMAYGVISMSVLLSIGIPPAAASAAIHTAEIFTTGVSGFTHAMFKNVDYNLLKRLIVPGIIGCVIGALFLSHVPEKIIKPFISGYLFILGTVIFYKSIREMPWMLKTRNLIDRALGREKPSHSYARTIPLGLVGGFSDAVGGGGWGGIVASSLLAQDEEDPRHSIGTTNLSEFLIALSASLTFAGAIGLSHWNIVLGLICGGIFAAPLAAFAVRYIPARVVMFIAGLVIMLISTYNFYRLFFKA